MTDREWKLGQIAPCFRQLPHRLIDRPSARPLSFAPRSADPSAPVAHRRDDPAPQREHPPTPNTVANAAQRSTLSPRLPPEATLDNPNAAVLRVLTTDPQPPDNLITLDNTLECADTYSCPCLACELDRQRAIRRGVRPSQPLPIKQRRAA